MSQAPPPSRPDPHGPRDDVDLTKGVRAKPRQSLRGGPESFSMTGRLIGTAIIVGIGILLYWLSGVATEAMGSGALAIVMVILGIYMVIAGMVLWGLWKPGRIDDPTARPQVPRDPDPRGPLPPGALGPPAN